MTVFLLLLEVQVQAPGNNKDTVLMTHNLCTVILLLQSTDIGYISYVI